MTMTAKSKRKHLIIYLVNADDKKINALHTLLKEDVNETSFTLNKEHMNIIEQRRTDYLSGKSKGSSWEEVHARVRSKGYNG